MNINLSLCLSFLASSNGIAQSNYDRMDSFQNAPVNKRAGKYYSAQNQGIQLIKTFEKS